MLNFFKGWKRKAGAVTLVMACVFAAGWVRSAFVGDSFHKMWKWRTFSCSSNDGLMAGSLIVYRPDEKLDKHHLGWTWKTEKPMKAEDRMNFDLPESIINQRWSRFHIGFALGNSHSTFLIRCFCPYWSIVIPLTLLSAWLLLSKPPAPKQPVST